jgi:hypothetical protein
MASLTTRALGSSALAPRDHFFEKRSVICICLRVRALGHTGTLLYQTMEVVLLDNYVDTCIFVVRY